MYAILSEDKADTDSLKCLVRRISGIDNLPVKTWGFDGCGDLLKRADKFVRLFSREGCNKFIICCDCDGSDPSDRSLTILSKFRASGVDHPHLILIPVHELEAWILADNAAMKNVIKSWVSKEFSSPEKMPDPKGILVKMSRGENRKPRYDPVNHNPKIAVYLDLDKVESKCPSFVPLVDFVRSQL
jgi:hypothetical protein